MKDQKKPICKLTGTSNHGVAIIGNVRRALINAGQRDKAKEWIEVATKTSYERLITKAMDFVEVT